jgi:hypothetical protein
MKLSATTIFLAGLLLAGCSDNVNRAFYEGFKNQNDAEKTPNERAMTPTSSYGTYQKERENMKQNDPAEEINASPASAVK